VTVLVSLLLAPFILVTISFAVELFVGLRPLRRVENNEKIDGSAVIVVPAHNEEAIIGESLRRLRDAACDDIRILVIADNCEDRTADVARSFGVDVAERADSQLRGKGFALAYARNFLRAAPPDVVVIIDADCRSDSQSIGLLVNSCMATGRPCQATNLQTPAPAGSPSVQLSTFAFFIKNVIRQRALQRIAGRAHLLGTGMAFPWCVFDQAALATANVAEDTEIGIELAEGGKPALFVEDASVWSDPETHTKLLAQRERWEGGFLQNARYFVPVILKRSLRHADVRGLWAAINLLIPPIALLILLDFLAIVAGAASLLIGSSAWPTAVLAFSLLLSCAALFFAWAAGGSRFVTLGCLARIPAYVLWKIPMYMRFVRRGTPQDWIRTR
jgi:cellulose synthase/poly-beta-1,6-N-acetylglucosamine synthase-like glycosyltransferase